MREMKGVNYYVLDMEWSQTKGMIQPLELAVLPVETDADIFFRYIRPEDVGRISRSAYKLLKINKNKIKGAPDFRTVIRELRDYTGKGEGRKNIAIIWHDTTKENFTEACKRYRVRSPFSEIVSLREVLVTAQKRDKNKNSFERLMYEYNIEFDKNALHNAGYDARHLKQLFLAVVDKAAQYEPQRGLISNTGSGIIHSGSCRYCKDMTTDRRKEFDMGDLYRGYRTCKICGRNIHPWIPAPTKEEMKLVKIMENIGNIGDKEQFLDSSVAAMCIKFGFDYEKSDQCIEIRTSCGRWKIYHDAHRVTRVYHGNHYGRTGMKGIHEQKNLSNSLYSVLRYISRHDSALEQNKTKKQKGVKFESRMERKVSHHVKRNYYVEKDEWEEYYEDDSKVNKRK